MAIFNSPNRRKNYAMRRHTPDNSPISDWDTYLSGFPEEKSVNHGGGGVQPRSWKLWGGWKRGWLLLILCLSVWNWPDRRLTWVQKNRPCKMATKKLQIMQRFLLPQNLPGDLGRRRNNEDFDSLTEQSPENLKKISSHICGKNLENNSNITSISNGWPSNFF